MVELQSFPLRHGETALEGQIAVPEGQGQHPAVLVMANAYGLGEQSRTSALELAEHGYVGVATDMYGGGAYAADPSSAGAEFTAIMANPELLRAHVRAWFDAVAARPEVDPARIAAIGYCFGGKCVLELARMGAPVRAVVSYHGLLTTDRPAQPGAVAARIVAYCGALDPYAPPEQIDGLRQELAAAGVRHHVTIFSEAAHSFTDPDAGRSGRPGIVYDPLAHRISWAGTIALLETELTA